MNLEAIIFAANGGSHVQWYRCETQLDSRDGKGGSASFKSLRLLGGQLSFDPLCYSVGPDDYAARVERIEPQTLSSLSESR
jgi:hypothetical protein